MAGDLKFFGWQRSSVYDLATAALEGGRLQAALPLTLKDRDNPGNAVTQSVPFLISGAKDVTGLQPSAILRTYPAQGDKQAETTKFAHVEVCAADLPWRYTPQIASGDTLRPWFVLIVGTKDEITLGPSKTLICAQSVAASHPLSQSARWAHVQQEGSLSFARVVSPRSLTAETDYIAAVVPAFDDAGAARWSNAGFTAPYYYLWRFSTGEAGDFESLAGALQPGTADPTAGRAPMVYPRVQPPVEVSVRGAIGPLFGPDTTLPANIASDMALLQQALTDPKGRPIIGLPEYGSAWAQPAAAVWGQSINGDPRHRGVAGLGMRASVELQDQLVDAATTQAGALGEAAQRIRQLTFGLMSARSLWNRRLPKDPAHRLTIYGPSMRRIVTANGPVLNEVAGGSRPLPPAIFSTAARRVLRRGPARTERANPGATVPHLVLQGANTCPAPPPRQAPGVPHVDDLAKQMGLLPLEDVIGKLTTGNEDLLGIIRAAAQKQFSFLQKYLPEIARMDRDRLQALVDAIRSGRAEMVERWISGNQPGVEPGEPGGPLSGDDLPEIYILITAEYEMHPCSPVNLDELEKVLTAAIDPTLPEPIVVRRVLGTIEGLGPQPLAPVEVCIGVDFPMWTWLRDRMPDWLLPGLSDLQPNAVMAFESNSTFVDAFLLGLNTQFVSELRWRNIPLAAGCTPLRMFWGPADFASNKRLPDIHGIANWTNASVLGDASHQAGAITGTDLIVVMRTELFQRYPGALVYLIKPKLTNSEPDWTADPPSYSDRLLPSFHGRIGEDIVFFRFDIAPSDARKRWVVLEEPPAEITFRNDKPAGAQITDGASFAIATIDQPTRVLIKGTTLIPEP